MQALLDKQPLRRPSCERLLEHPFLWEDEPQEAVEATAEPSSASKAAQGDAAARSGLKPATEASKQNSDRTPGSTRGAYTEKATKSHSLEQPDSAPPSARYAQAASRLYIVSLLYPCKGRRMSMLSRWHIRGQSLIILQHCQMLQVSVLYMTSVRCQQQPHRLRKLNGAISFAGKHMTCVSP